jgi:hypothetical protein
VDHLRILGGGWQVVRELLQGCRSGFRCAAEKAPKCLPSKIKSKSIPTNSRSPRLYAYTIAGQPRRCSLSVSSPLYIFE